MKQMLLDFLLDIDGRHIDSQRDVFQTVSKQVQAQKSLPSPTLIVDVLQTYAKEKQKTLWSCAFQGNEECFFIQSVWMKICHAIECQQPIIEIGSGSSYFLVLAALCGADCIGIESPEDKCYQPSVIDSRATLPQEGMQGSFQMYHMESSHLKPVDDGSKEKLLRMWSKRQPQESSMLRKALQLSDFARRKIETAISNQSAIQVVTKLESLLPNDKKLEKGLAFCSMPPFNVYGMGYLFNRLLDKGVSLLLWGEEFGAVYSSTPIWPSLNRRNIAWLSALDASHALTQEERDLVHHASKVGPLGLTNQESERLKEVSSKQAHWGFAGHALEELNHLRNSLGLSKSENELGYVNMFSGKQYYDEPKEYSKRYAALLSSNMTLFYKGQQVRVDCLTSEKGLKLNGSEGIVLSDDPKDENRVKVELFSSQPGQDKVRRSIKRGNLFSIKAADLEKPVNDTLEPSTTLPGPK